MSLLDCWHVNCSDFWSEQLVQSLSNGIPRLRVRSPRLKAFSITPCVKWKAPTPSTYSTSNHYDASQTTLILYQEVLMTLMRLVVFVLPGNYVFALPGNNVFWATRKQCFFAARKQCFCATRKQCFFAIRKQCFCATRKQCFCATRKNVVVLPGNNVFALPGKMFCATRKHLIYQNNFCSCYLVIWLSPWLLKLHNFSNYCRCIVNRLDIGFFALVALSIAFISKCIWTNSFWQLQQSVYDSLQTLDKL